jgi:FkbM family methyltransferase
MPTSLGIRIFKKIYRIADFPSIMVTYRDVGLYLKDRAGIWSPKPVFFRLRGGIKFLISKKGEAVSADTIWRKKSITKMIPIRDGDVVVDIGAHIGYFAVFAGTHAKNVKVYAYEPVPDTFNKLAANALMNCLPGTINCFKMGVAAERGMRKIYISDDDNVSNSIFLQHAPSVESIDVRVTTLENIFSENGIERCGFLKINAEGAEYEILLRSPDEVIRRIDRFAVQYHDGAKSLVARFSSLGFQVIDFPEKNVGRGLLIVKRS